MATDTLRNIEQLITNTFEKARKNGDITFEESKVVTQLIDGCSYQVRFVPGLENKPDKGDAKKSDDDPLAPPYKDSLHVCDFPNYGLNELTYAVILNKFALVKNHCLLTPHEFIKQSEPLTADELTLAYLIIRNHRTKVIAFFNCGEESGASQKHKHIQFFPVADDEPPIEVYTRNAQDYEEARQLAHVPWAHFAVSIQPPEQADELGNYLMNKFIQLLDEMFQFKEGKEFDGAKASYNVLITKNYLHIIPRSKQEYELSNGSKVSIGGICYAGILIVKQEEDLDEMKKAGVTNVLFSLGRKRDD